MPNISKVTTSNSSAVSNHEREALVQESTDSDKHIDAFEATLTSSLALQIAEPRVDRFVKKIVDWESPHRIYYAGRWPIKTLSVDYYGEPNDPSNLFAKDGILAKYDRVFKKNTREYELANNAQPFDAWHTIDWSHATSALSVACLFKEPMKSVRVGDQEFSPWEIKGLLCKVVDDLLGETDYIGERLESDDSNGITASDFIERITEHWCSKDKPARPFVLDFFDNKKISMHAYDQVRVFESDFPPPGFDRDSVPNNAKFYRVELRGDDVPREAQTLQCWIARGLTSEKPKSGWILDERSLQRPEFAWRPCAKGALHDARTWTSIERARSNPEIVLKDVFEVYIQSIS